MQESRLEYKYWHNFSCSARLKTLISFVWRFICIDRASQEMAFPFRVANCKTFRIRDKISETVLEESPFSFNPPETRKKLHCVSINSCVISRNCLLPNTGSIYELRRFLYLLLVDSFTLGHIAWNHSIATCSNWSELISGSTVTELLVHELWLISFALTSRYDFA